MTSTKLVQTRRATLLGLTLLLCICFSLDAWGQDDDREGAIEPDQFLRLLTRDSESRERALVEIAQSWRTDSTAPLLEVTGLIRNKAFTTRTLDLLREKTGQDHGDNLEAWYKWLWSMPAPPSGHYAEFKSALYARIDPRFQRYFGQHRRGTIRLDEVRWGGVRQDGIPPLRQPDMTSVHRASYLADTDIVYGTEINGDARAYPQRIFAWHELFTDVVGGVPVAGIYSPLAGTVVLYATAHRSGMHELGTSGFLYRSDKLVYDRATGSLWGTLEGSPLIGPLAGQGIRLQRMPLTTTTWGEWRRRHPQTRVLSIHTGEDRDYSEGAAYRDYLATDELWFAVPRLDERLKNKAQVLGLTTLEPAQATLAIAASYLSAHSIHHDRLGRQRLVVLTDRSGASRVFETKDITFAEWDGDRRTVDETGVSWSLEEDRLQSEDGRRLRRLPVVRAFWFAWYNAYPDTRLVH